MIYFGTGNGLLYAVNLRDGDVRWTFEAGNHIKATPAYDGDRLYVGAWDGHFYSVDARSGDLIWKKRINTPHFSPTTSNPKLLNGRVYFVSHDYRTHCFDAETGDVIWQYLAGDIEFQWNSPIVAECKPSYSSAVFHGETVHFCSLTGHVVGFHQDTGELVFQKQVSGPVFDSFPVLVRDIMYFGTTRGALNALNLRTGEMTWEYSTGYHYIFSGPATDGQLLAIGNMGGWLSVFPVSAEG